MIQRRNFITLLGGATVWPLTAHAQQAERVRRVGVLMGFGESDRASQSLVAEFRTALANLGWKEGSNLRIELRWCGKWVELLKEIAPRTVRVALLFNPATAPSLEFYMPSIQAAASSFAIQVSAAPVHARDEIESVVAAQARDRGGGIIVMPDAFNATNRELIIALAARYSLPAIYGNNFAESGGLIFYGADFAESFRLAAGYIDRILKGAKPGELPIQLPTKFELAINLKTAKALGLDVPLPMQQRADEVIE